MAATNPAPRGSASPAGMIPPEWPAQAADTIVDTIEKVRDRTTKPLMVAARALVYGVLIASIGTVALVLFLVLLVRALDNWLPGNVWTVYAGFAVVFSAAGFLLLRKANRPAPTADA